MMMEKNTNDKINQKLLTKIHLVSDKLINLGGADYEQDRSVIKAELNRGMVARDFGIEEWDWPQGIGLYGLNKLQNFYGDKRYMTFLNNWFLNNIEKGMPSRNINTTAPFLALVDLLDSLDNPKYERLCTEHAEWLMAGLPKTRENCFQHVTTAIGSRDKVQLNEGELWIDTLFMAVLFLAKMGLRCKRQDWISEAVRQVLAHIKYLYDKQTGLFFHGWSFPLNSNFGGIFWCRGNSWFTYGIMDFIDAFQDTMDPGLYSYFTDTYRAQVEALKKLQAPSGLWHTVLLDSTSYEEVSGSAAITAGILKGIRLGILDYSFLECTEKAVNAICDNVDSEGTVLNVSAGTGMGYNAEHYKNIAIHPMAYGQSLALIALFEALV